jgi:hypothetical protein
MRRFAALVGLALAGCEDRSYFGPDPELVLPGSARVDYALAIGDVDGDARADFLVRMLDGNWAGETLGTRAWIVSGRGAATLARLPSPLERVDRDSRVVLGDDLDGDGAADLVVGSTRQYVSGRDGRELRRLGVASVFPPTACALASDVDGDGAREIALGTPLVGDDPALCAGRVELISSRDGSVVAALDGHTAYEQIGACIEPRGDVDGDGAIDLAVGAPGGPGRGRISVRSGRDLRELDAFTAEALDATAVTFSLGHAFVVCGDVDGDGEADFAIEQGDVWYVVSFEKRATLAVPGASDWRVDAWLGDWDGDGVRDFVRGRTVDEELAFDNHVWCRYEVVSTRTHTVLLSVADASGPFSVAFDCGDFDGDGCGDLALDFGCDQVLAYGSATRR